MVAAQTPRPIEAAQPMLTRPGSDERPDEDIIRSPDSITIPRPELLPRLKEYLSTLPPFFRDTSLKLRSRTFYFNRQNDDGTANEALATGGWLQYTSGWLLDTFGVGATYYMSFPLYAPESRSGSLILTPVAKTS
ncbi:MAG TPA: hypothetical protein VFD67_11780 [Gemmatimonadaceae bacterium]|nr:hypothetical protein [Gemmatimonadaceae bacterium]